MPFVTNQYASASQPIAAILVGLALILFGIPVHVLDE
jgi:hypothetical protein